MDATSGNGHDTEFLCRLAGPTGRVLALDIQPAAVENTNTRLGAAGLGAIGQALVYDHARLAELVAPGTADCVLFNFGWLPGADHEVHSTADGSLSALQAALDALKPRGVLAAVLYSGQFIGDSEKQAALGRSYRAELEQEFVTLALMLDMGLSEKALRQMAGALEAEQLRQARSAMRKKAAMTFPMQTQLTGKAEHAQKPDSAFLI